MAFKSFQLEKIQRPKKIESVSATAEHGGHLEGFLATLKGQTTSSTPIINYYRGLREGLEILIFSISTNNHCRGLRKGLETLIFSAPINNHCCNLKEELETQLGSKTSTSFVCGSNIPNIKPSSIEPAKIGNALWHRHCRRSGIKDLIPAACSLYKYIWEIILCIVLIGKEYLGSDIWPETPNQAKGIKNMIRTVWSEDTYYWQKISGTKTFLLSFSGKKVRHVSLLIFYYVTIGLLNRHRF